MPLGILYDVRHKAPSGIASNIRSFPNFNRLRRKSSPGGVQKLVPCQPTRQGPAGEFVRRSPSELGPVPPADYLISTQTATFASAAASSARSHSQCTASDQASATTLNDSVDLCHDTNVNIPAWECVVAKSDNADNASLRWPPLSLVRVPRDPDTARMQDPFVQEQEEWLPEKERDKLKAELQELHKDDAHMTDRGRDMLAKFVDSLTLNPNPPTGKPLTQADVDRWDEPDEERCKVKSLGADVANGAQTWYAVAPVATPRRSPNETRAKGQLY